MSKFMQLGLAATIFLVIADIFLKGILQVALASIGVVLAAMTLGEAVRTRRERRNVG